MQKSNHPKIDPAKPKRVRAKAVKDAVAHTLPDLSGRHVYVVQTSVSMYSVVDGESHRHSIGHMSIHASPPTVDSIIECVKADPIMGEMRDAVRYRSFLADCLYAFGIPDVQRSPLVTMDETIGKYHTRTLTNVWHASIENDERGFSTMRKELGHISVSRRTIWP